MIVKSTFDRVSSLKFTEGLVLLGCGGSLKEWVNGVTKALREDGILAPKAAFKKAYHITTTGGRIDLVLVLPKSIDIGKLAVWRIGFGDCSWWSDYRTNYASQHGVLVPSSDDDYECDDG